jgi:flagellar motor switch protein FliG
MIRFQAGLKQVALTFDTIGFEYANQIFESLHKEQWDYLETVFYTCPETYTQEQIERTLQEVYQQLLSEVMTRQKMSESNSDADPFLFLRSISDETLKNLISQFHSVKVALISAYWHEHEMARILKLLESEKRREVILQINRLQKLPEEFGLQAATSFAKELEHTLYPQAEVLPPPFKSKEASSSVKPSQAEINAAIQRITARASQKEELELLKFIQQESPELKRQFEKMAI